MNDHVAPGHAHPQAPPQNPVQHMQADPATAMPDLSMEALQELQARLPIPDQWGRGPTPQVPLILSETPVAQDTGLPIQPGRALLYSTDTGEIVALAKPPKMWKKRSYHWRYEVDLSSHFHAIHLQLPSLSPATHFRLTVDVGWRVFEPAKIVQWRVSDGYAIVRSRIAETLQPLCRRFTITQDGALEAYLIEQIGQGRTHRYEEGLEVFRFSVQVSHDPNAAGRMAEGVDASHKAELAREQIVKWRSAIRTEDDLIYMLIDKKPDRVGEIINDIRQRREASMGARLELFNKLVDGGLVQEADMENIRDLILQPIEGLVRAEPTGAFGIEQQPPKYVPPAIAPAPARREEPEDVLPAQIVEGSVDNVAEWTPPPWSRTDENGGRR
ncbi:hypothetical protein FDA94_26625 [Herbidospora galbida]|uniref:Band 7 domain-containing protein n=1 Tax=Herbidospora galbida TaxID=2575442 RepID=A0A4U3MC08_9ACTN|nr:hypothetical protein [Herbidospora galbida]TKK85247.1 hypothetical protein FDA94_26625 [Herbidospora galbida]